MTKCSPEEYREEVWEGKTIRWGAWQIRTGERPAKGDGIFLWFAKTGNKEPGIYGWGVIMKYEPRSNHITFRPAHPSDYLKMYPLYNRQLERIVSEVRGKMKAATMWRMEERHALALREMIRERIE